MGTTLSMLWGACFGRQPPPVAFVYQSTLDRSSIRLLHYVRPKWYMLRRGRPKLEMQTYTLDKLPKYVALSYTWGPPQDGVGGYDDGDRPSVLLDGQLLPISRNLMDALE